MDKNNNHIDKLIREKFDAFSPAPPKHIWTGIEMEISTIPSAYFLSSKRNIAVLAIVILALTTSIIWFNPSSTRISDDPQKNIATIPNSNEVISDSEVIVDNSDKEVNQSNRIIVDTEKPLNNEKQPAKIVITNSKEPNIELQIVNNENKESLTTKHNIQNTKLSLVKLKQSVFIQPELSGNNYIPKQQNYTSSLPQGSIIEPTTSSNNSHWKIGYYISPELSISDFDSVQILNSYTISAEPSYFINKNLFVRFGAGLSFVRDRGFARISYLTNEYMGSYNDVYDITFDTISGIVTPVYHTKTVEIWDSVRHVSVSEVTNKYVYLQVPLLLGYYHKKPGSEFGWYFMGGPAFNIKVSSWVDNPKPEAKDADIIDLQNNLPIRSNNYFQLWIGAGLEYEINKKLSIAVEPSYRYYFKSIYSNPYKATSSSGVSLRIGLIYNMK